MGSIQKDIWFFVIGLLFWFVLTLPGSAQSTEVHRLVPLKDGKVQEAVKEAVGDGVEWKTCGSYFATGESTKGKLLYFNFDGIYLGKPSTAFVAAPIGQVLPATNEKAMVPMVGIIWIGLDSLFILNMTTEEYKIGLPCFSKGTSI